MSAEQLITDHIDIWTSAVQAKSASGRGSSKKRELYGIKKLRELILELAVRGKLVPQDPNDEPASVLLERIAAEKAQLIEQGKIKKSKSLIPDTEFSTPFELPLGWEWAWLGNVCHIERGGSPRPIKSFLTDAPDGLNWIKIGDTDIGGKYITQTAEKIRPEGLTKTRMVYPEDFLLTNSMSFGRPYITKIEGCIHDGWLRISPPISLDKDYLYNLLSSPFIKQSFSQSAAGAVVMNLNADKVAETLIAIPPTEEQHRIVAKVDELMALSDQLELRSESQLAAHQTLVETLLATLTDSGDADELAQNWARLSTHFDTLFTTEASIDALKQTILQLAIMGKLVSQDPSDEPASTLLERIAAEKAQLVKEKKIKKEKPQPAISEDEKPFELPKGWEWCRLGQVINLVSGQHLKPNEYSENSLKNGVPYITGPAEFGSKHPIYSKYTTEFRALAKKDDILITCKGAGLGKLNLANETIAISRQLMAIQLLKGNLEFLFILVNSQYKYFQDKGVGIAIPGISRSDVEELVLMLPPLEEQNRIVAKVDELMTLCDRLKTRLQTSQQTQLALAEALVEQAL